MDGIVVAAAKSQPRRLLEDRGILLPLAAGDGLHVELVSGIRR